MASALRYTLVTELTNLFRHHLSSTTFDGGLPRESSLVGGELPNLAERHAEVDEMGVKIVGLRLLGGAHLSGKKVTADEDSTFRYLTSPGERVVECFPLKFFCPRQQRRGNSLWVMPMAMEEHEEFARVAGRGAALHDLLERFQLLWYSVDSFAELLAEAALALELAELEADAMGPRSIQDVRRQRQRNAEDDDGSETDGETPLSEEGSSKVSIARQFVSSAQDIADKEVARNALSVGVIWVCRWRGKLRWGLHHLPRVGYSAAQLKPPNPKALSVNGAVPGARAALQFALLHVASVELTNIAARDVAVTLTVRSFVDREVVLSVRVRPPMAGPGAGTTRTKSADHGLAWTGQVAYHEVSLTSFGEVKLDFVVQALARGVHDLNRCVRVISLLFLLGYVGC